MEVTNELRAAWAETAIQAFAEETGLDVSGELEHEPELVLGDLLCDLMHLAERRGFDFDQILQGAQADYECERQEEEDEV